MKSCFTNSEIEELAEGMIRQFFGKMQEVPLRVNIEIKLAYLIQRIGTEYLKNRRNKGFRHIWRDRKPFSFYDSSYSDMKQK